MALSITARIGRSTKPFFDAVQVKIAASAKYSCSSSNCRAVRRFFGL